jgi:hypothetical protein
MEAMRGGGRGRGPVPRKARAAGVLPIAIPNSLPALVWSRSDVIGNEPRPVWGVVGWPGFSAGFPQLFRRVLHMLSTADCGNHSGNPVESNVSVLPHFAPIISLIAILL